MAEKGKKDKADTKVEQPAAAAPPTSNLPATREDNKLADPYTDALVAAQETLKVALYRVKNELTDDKEKAEIDKLIESANPSVKGLEEVDTAWSVPEIRVVQGMTREKPDNARVGDLYTTGGDKLPSNLNFTPLYIYESNRMFPSEGKGPVCFAPDAKLGTLFGLCRQCPNLPLGKNTTGQFTDCDNGICAIVLSEDMKLYRIQFFRTSKKAGLKLMQYAKQSEAGLWGRWYMLGTTSVQNERGEFYVLKVSPSGNNTPQHIRLASDQLYAMIAAERKAFVKQHWDQVMSGGQKASAVDENVDFSDLAGDNPAGGGGANPDLSDAM